MTKPVPKLTKREIDVLLYIIDSASSDGDPLKHYEDPAAGYAAFTRLRSKLRKLEQLK